MAERDVEGSQCIRIVGLPAEVFGQEAVIKEKALDSFLADYRTLVEVIIEVHS